MKKPSNSLENSFVEEEPTSYYYEGNVAITLKDLTYVKKKKYNQKFNYNLSERIVALADLYSFGYEVFEDESRFNDWMFHPNQALGGKVPFDFIDNQYGREEIHNLIGRIAYGIYS